MAVNNNRPDRWKEDTALSVDMYNDWFMRFAPEAFRTTREQTTKEVQETFAATRNLTDVGVELLRAKPSVLPTLRMSTCPPLARDRLVGLAGVSSNLVEKMEKDHCLPPRMGQQELDNDLRKIGEIIVRLADPGLFVWLGRQKGPTEKELYRAATIVADRLCGAEANPIIRNAQEQRQISAIGDWLSGERYRYVSSRDVAGIAEMAPGTYTFQLNVPVFQQDSGKSIKLPVDAVVMPKLAKDGDFPLLIEAKSAGDFTNVNKRRKEEATKIKQLRANYGERVRFVLFLCGYFDSGYLGYEAAEGIDWVWEHRIDDLGRFGL